MKKELIITDLTRMGDIRVCIAATDFNGQSYRLKPVRRFLRVDWCCNQDQILCPFTGILVNLIRSDQNPPHTEDWFFDDKNIQYRGVLKFENKKEILNRTLSPSVSDIFGAEICQDFDQASVFVLSGTGNRSLGTILASSVDNFSYRCFDGRWDYRISFCDQQNQSYRLKITDLTFQMYVDHLRVNCGMDPIHIGRLIRNKFNDKIIYLRIGLARGWANYPDRCYLQINGIYTFPDYLEGKCFADFQIDEAMPVADDEIAF